MASVTRSLHSGRFALFAECLLTGVWIALAALPLVTALPAFAAGAAHLERHLAGDRSRLRDYLADLRAATRTGWRLSALWCAALALLGWDLYVASSGALPGAPLWALTGLAAAFVLLVGGVRAAARYRPADDPEPGGDWRACALAGVRQTLLTDRPGALLVAAGWVVVAASAWMLPPLAAPALGALTACAVAIRDR
ncbi:hypothetical protein [Streptomyces boncukensis]|uniref:Uncharacterized protein n=1 Tax=Streptomyces boncukensis TaxID=2711219 RepID=A0A6G4X3H0_9ACTN|nr:hypothetical protein [Streptomyces boncukensis]NGO71397.1 hypothetical protein [Streptomyces boncukensis]